MKKEERRLRRKRSIRKKVFGTGERPRVCIHKSRKNIYVQIVDDIESKTLCSLSTRSRVVSDKFKKSVTRTNTESAAILGAEIAKIALPKGIKKVVFDRSGYQYHGVVKVFADTARENGLEF